MHHYALIGERLGHSLSVPIHQAVYRHLGLQADYRLIEIGRDSFGEETERLFSQLDGFNITIPYKQTILPYLARLDPFAKEIGAVNTVLTADQSGYNTDAPGFSAMLRHAGIDPAGKPCWILGSGGAAKAVRSALLSDGASSVQICSRHPGHGSVSYDTLENEFSGILVNCTPCGMWPDTSGCPLPAAVLARLLPKAAAVADVIYNPSETVLTTAAKESGIPACTGLYMLIAQAVEAESIWQRLSLTGLADQLMKELALI